MSMMPASGSAADVSPATIAAAPFGDVVANVIASMRASRFNVSSWRPRRAFTASEAATTTSGTLAPAGTFISVRTERISLINAISEPISSSALASARPASVGQLLSASKFARGAAPAVFSHNSSVMNGMNGCSSAVA